MFLENAKQPRRSPEYSGDRTVGMFVSTALAGAGLVLGAVPGLVRAADSSDRDIETIVVIGSNRAGTQVELESSSPVHLILSEQLQSTGAQTLNEALSKLDPSFNFPQGQNNLQGQGVRSASLRGVAPAYTLVLVNGKRRHTASQLSGTQPYPASQVVDINAIPISAIERVEILKDGAAAQYGSDAIAGVINLVLKDSSRGGGLSALQGGYTDGGGTTTAVNGWKGLSLGSSGTLTLSVDLLKSAQISRTDPDWRQLFPNSDPRIAEGVRPDADWNYGQASREYGSVLGNLSFDLGEERELYGWFNLAHKTTDNNTNGERVVKANNSVYPPTDGTRISQTANLSLYPNGYQPHHEYIAKDIAGAVGLRLGVVETGRLDIAVSSGKSDIGRTAYTTTNPSWGPASQRDFYYGSWVSDQTSLTAEYVRDVAPRLFASPITLSVNAIGRRENWRTGDLGDPQTYTGGPYAGWTVGQYYSAFPELIPAGLNAATIASIRADTTLLGFVSTGGTPNSPEDKSSNSRDVYGLGVGAETDITDRFQLGLAARFEHYSDFGKSTTGRITGKFDLSPAVALRSTLSTGFHAPSLAQIGTQSTGYTGTNVNSGSGTDLVLGRTRSFRPDDPVAAAFGAKPLDPETSETISFGTVIQPATRSSFTVDVYYLKIKDAINSSSSLRGNNVIAAFNAAGLGGFTQASYYLNAWDTTTRGVDVSGKTAFDAWGGTFDLFATFSAIETEVDESSIRRTTVIQGVATPLVTDEQLREAETAIPSTKTIVGGQYTLGSWSVNTTVTRYGDYTFNATGSNGIHDQTFSPEVYLDLSLSYQANDSLNLSLSAKNLLNEYPDPLDQGNRQSGVGRHSFINPNGASGRFAYVGLNYSF